jgi:hypothetical protein
MLRDVRNSCDHHSINVVSISIIIADSVDTSMFCPNTISSFQVYTNDVEALKKL